MILLMLLGLLMPELQDTPYKPSEQFQLKLDLSFKQRPSPSANTFNYAETRGEYEKRTNTSPTPYLVLKVKLDTITVNEDRLRVFRDHHELVLSKKNIVDGTEFDIDVGFLEDVKDGVKGYIHEIKFYDAKRNEVSRITIEFDKEGNYLVNGEKRGKI